MFNDNNLINLINGINERIIASNIEIKNCIKNSICIILNGSLQKNYSIYCDNSPELFFKNGSEYFDVFWDDNLIDFQNKSSQIVNTNRGTHTLRIMPKQGYENGELIITGTSVRLR